MAIYALLDFDTLQKYNISFEEFIKVSKGLKVKILQYRDKNSSFDEKLKRIKLIRKLWKKTLIVNDDINLLRYADGIHIGQEDLGRLCKEFNLDEYEVINNLKSGKFIGLDNKFIVGLSTHNKEEILKANKLPLDYIGLGAYRKTSTKDTSNILGKSIIDLIKISYHPVAVIGGVRIYDKIPAKFKVVGSDICKLISTQSKKKRILKKR